MSTKRCSKCKNILPVGEFYIDRTREDGIQGMCKSCFAEYYQSKKQHKPIIVKRCKFCDVEFTTRSTVKKYCNAECLRKFRNTSPYKKKKAKLVKNCKNCTNEFIAKRCTHVFCSDKCYDEFHCLKNEYKKHCIVCENEFTTPFKAKESCSLECRKIVKKKNDMEYIKKNKQRHRSRREYQKKYRSTEKFKKKNREKWHKRQAVKRSLPCNLTPDEWQDTLSRFDGKCVYCGDEWEHQDHLWPFSKAGGYTRNNIVPSCAPCNLSKTDKYPADFIPKVALFEILHTLGVH